MSTESNRKKQSFKQIKYGALISYASVCLNIVAGILFTPWIIKQIGKSDYGLYTLALSIVAFFTMDFGLGESVSRFLTKYNVEKKSSKKKNFLGITFKLYLIIDILIFIVLIILYICSDFIYAELTAEELMKFKVVFILIGVNAIASFPFQPLNGILISHEKFIFLKFMDLFQRLTTVIILASILMMKYGLYGLISVNVFTNLLTIIVKVYYIKKEKLIEINFRVWNSKLLREIFSFSIWIAIIAFAQRFIFNITPSVLAAFSGSSEIALFSVASSMEGYVWLIASALNGLFLPKITEMVLVDNDIKEVENLMVKIGRIQLIILGLLFSGFIVLGHDFIKLWLGNEFSSSYMITVLLIAPSLITLTQQIANTALLAKNLVKYHCLGVVVMSLISIALSILLSPKYGAFGAGVAIFFGTIIGCVLVLNYVYIKILKIDLVNFYRKCHLKLIVPILITMIVGFVIQNYFYIVNWKYFSIKVVLITLVYLLSVWYLGLNKYEKEIIKMIFNKLRIKVRN